MTKKIALLVILLSFGFELNAKWTRPIDEEANADKYGFEHDFCPKTNYGHTAIIVDTTEKFNEYQYALLQNQILNNGSMADIMPYDRISIYDLTGRNVTATQTKPIFSKCRPRSGENLSKFEDDHPSFWHPANPMKQQYAFFLNFPTSPDHNGIGLAQAREHFSDLEELSGQYSMIMEMIKEISRAPVLNFTDDDKWQNRKIIIFSDLLQNSDTLTIYNSCKRGKCITWDSVKDKPSVKQLMPSFKDENKPEVFVYYLHCKYNRKLENGTIEFWKGYFEDAGMKFNYDTETACVTENNKE